MPPILPLMCPTTLSIFDTYLENGKIFLDYGSGGSTLHALNYENLNKIISFENDPIWFHKINNLLKKNKNKEKIEYNFLPSYFNAIENIPANDIQDINIILIDGRHRVATCLNLFRYISNDCVILYDDFKYRYERDKIILEYFDIIEKNWDNGEGGGSGLVVLKKKKVDPPSKILIQKYEVIGADPAGRNRAHSPVNIL